MAERTGSGRSGRRRDGPRGDGGPGGDGRRAHSGRGDRRPTKAERRESARIQREEIQRRMRRQRKTRWITTTVAILAAVALVVGLILYQQGTASPDPEELLGQAADAARASGCTPVEDIGAYEPAAQDRSHIGGADLPQMPPLSSYPSIPPVSGPHNAVPLPAGTYDTPPGIDQVIHSLEHGAVAIWYDPSAAGEEVDEIETFFFGGPSGRDPQSGRKVIIAPYSYPDQGEAGRLPGGTQMALAAWHHVRECAAPSLATAYDFVSQYRTPPSSGRQSLSDAPEPNSGI